MKNSVLNYLESLRVKPGKKINLKKNFRTDNTQKFISKEEGEFLFEESKSNLAKMQDKLYANDQYSVLIIIQGMDASGKDGAIKHVMSGLNPRGVNVASFKVPAGKELDHDYFWRFNKELPARGEIGIFNRSYFENVLVTRVHPEFILNEKIPGIHSVNDITTSFWEKRYKQLRRFEHNLVENGTVILKFCLHVSKAEQKKRFLERIDNPNKNWKFSLADTEERKHWDSYMRVYESMLAATSTEQAPWFVIPADDKWFARLCISSIIHTQFEKLKLDYPKVSKEQAAKLQSAKKALLLEK